MDYPDEFKASRFPYAKPFRVSEDSEEGFDNPFDRTEAMEELIRFIGKVDYEEVWNRDPAQLFNHLLARGSSEVQIRGVGSKTTKIEIFMLAFSRTFTNFTFAICVGKFEPVIVTNYKHVFDYVMDTTLKGNSEHRKRIEDWRDKEGLERLNIVYKCSGQEKLFCMKNFDNPSKKQWLTDHASDLQERSTRLMDALEKYLQDRVDLEARPALLGAILDATLPLKSIPPPAPSKPPTANPTPAPTANHTPAPATTTTRGKKRKAVLLYEGDEKPTSLEEVEFMHVAGPGGDTRFLKQLLGVGQKHVDDFHVTAACSLLYE